MSDGRELTVYERHLTRRFMNARDEIYAWSELRIKARDALIVAMGDNIGLCNGIKILSVSRIKPLRFNAKRFQQDHPSLYAQYCEPGEPVSTLHTHATKDALGPNNPGELPS